ncbi:MAG: hypothetical protein MUE81_17465 [Thermoflexibacter sp.]|nr:hypothetical protein [Thermoflexibacter sp.]
MNTLEFSTKIEHGLIRLPFPEEELDNICTSNHCIRNIGKLSIFMQGLFELKVNCYNLRLLKQFLETLKVTKMYFLQSVQ